MTKKFLPVLRSSNSAYAALRVLDFASPLMTGMSMLQELL